MKFKYCCLFVFINPSPYCRPILAFNLDLCRSGRQTIADTSRKLSWDYSVDDRLCKGEWGTRAPNSHWPHDVTNLSLRIHPYPCRGASPNQQLRCAEFGLATQPEAVLVVRHRNVPWTYCRSTNARDLTKRRNWKSRSNRSRTDMIPQLIQRWRCRLFLRLRRRLCTFVL